MSAKYDAITKITQELKLPTKQLTEFLKEAELKLVKKKKIKKNSVFQNRWFLERSNSPNNI